ncbi:hypothetical protein [Sphingomonas elodea]|nr:hypothetical protein [Sphingomonas elodea]
MQFDTPHLIQYAITALVVGLFSAMRVEMYLRGRRLLAEARAAA